LSASWSALLPMSKEQPHHKKLSPAIRHAGNLTHFEAQFLRGFYSLLEGDHIQAVQLFSKAMSCEPREGSLWNIVGTIYLHQGKNKQAEESFKKAAAISQAMKHPPSVTSLSISPQSFPQHLPRNERRKPDLSRVLSQVPPYKKVKEGALGKPSS